jgi:hypothetical protein
MPRSISEYIQAMSRVGRKEPSIVFIVFHGNRMRDNSFYRYFYQIHDELDYLIEVVPILRWAKNAIKMMTPISMMGVLNILTSDNTGHGYPNVGQILWGDKKNEFMVSSIIEHVENGFMIGRSHSSYELEFKKDISGRITRIFEHFRTNSSKDSWAFDEIEKVYKDAISRGFRGKEPEVHILPTSTAGICIDLMKRQATTIDITGDIEEIKTTNEDEKDDLFDEEKNK